MRHEAWYVDVAGTVRQEQIVQYISSTYNQWGEGLGGGPFSEKIVGTLPP